MIRPCAPMSSLVPRHPGAGSPRPAAPWVALACVVCCLAGFAGGGCGSSGRDVTILTRPEDATLRIDEVERGRAPVTEHFTSSGRDNMHKVTASRYGFNDKTVMLKEDSADEKIVITLSPRARTVTFSVAPVPAIVSVDGKPLSDAPVSQITTQIEFRLDASNEWLPHLVTAERPKYRKVEQAVKWTDQTPDYALNLEPLRKDLKITTTPPGAEVFINSESVGASPVSYSNYAFPINPATSEFVPQKVRAHKPGFDDREIAIGWDDGKTDYHVDLVPRSKLVTVATDPPDAVVKVDGTEMPRDAAGVSSTKLAFPPVDDQGALKSYTVVASKKTADVEWEATPLRIGWDNGQAEYKIVLREVKTRQVPLLRPKFVRTEDGWQVAPDTLVTLASKDVAEPAGAPAPVRVLGLDKADAAGAVIDTLATSPDGAQIVFTVLSSAAAGKGELHSQLRIVAADGSDPPKALSDDKNLALTPSFSPDGAQVLFSSNRDGKRLNIWSAPADGSHGPTQVTAGETTDVWPSLDPLPKPRLFFESHLDTRPDPRLYVTPLKGAPRADLGQTGRQPHVSPKADAVLFCAVNETTSRRDLFTVPDTGGETTNLTNTPDYDDFDPAWSKDGSKIAFVSDRPAKAGPGGKPGDYNLWVLDLAHPESPIQVTSNPSWDDCPAWDVSGKTLYFRSNRGGEWAIWKIAVK